MTLTHRRIINNEQTNKVELQAIGMPIHISLESWCTWEDAYVEIVTQCNRFIKNSKSHLNKSQ